ncbi:MAG: hypothetical protein ABIJ21_00465 [Nanoarchaeota archaeon]
MELYDFPGTRDKTLKREAKNVFKAAFTPILPALTELVRKKVSQAHPGGSIQGLIEFELYDSFNETLDHVVRTLFIISIKHLEPGFQYPISQFSTKRTFWQRVRGHHPEELIFIRPIIDENKRKIRLMTLIDRPIPKTRERQEDITKDEVIALIIQHMKLNTLKNAFGMDIEWDFTGHMLK